MSFLAAEGILQTWKRAHNPDKIFLIGWLVLEIVGRWKEITELKVLFSLRPDNQLQLSERDLFFDITPKRAEKMAGKCDC